MFAFVHIYTIEFTTNVPSYSSKSYINVHSNIHKHRYDGTDLREICFCNNFFLKLVKVSKKIVINQFVQYSIGVSGAESRKTLSTC